MGDSRPVIRVNKPTAAPPHLLDAGARATQRLKDEYDAAPADFATKALAISRSIYAHASVVQALRLAQHNKCCFCERKAEGDVEHFRPKNGYQQVATDKLQYPGYYWLAYEWPNLFFACGPCNQRHKRNLFPLADPTRRARSHHDDAAGETPLLLDPAADQPEDHIQFHQELAQAVNGDPRGQTTIDVLRLNREDLRESRLDKYKIVVVLRDTLETIRRVLLRFRNQDQPPPPELLSNAQAIWATLLQETVDETEYASMCRSALRAPSRL
jgi:uncharacterized protein (TIGR02646 family)